MLKNHANGELALSRELGLSGTPRSNKQDRKCAEKKDRKPE